jgi:hypothetical protein
MSQYKRGNGHYMSERQAEKIQEGLRRVGTELSNFTISV